MTLKLVSARIKNFKSLGDVDLNFRDLTILVGANASGKSNSLDALNFLKKILNAPSLPPLDYMDSILRTGEKQISYQITIEDDEINQKAEYSISLSLSDKNTLIEQEYLLINGIEVINISNGKGIVKDEDGGNSQIYDSEGDGLALTDAGKYGKKPFTKNLASYIKDWKFYDVNPDKVRGYPKILKMINTSQSTDDDEIIASLDSSASKSQEILQYWARYDEHLFKQISQELNDILNIRLDKKEVKDGKPVITVIEKDGKKLALFNLSNGTLRLVAYLIMLYQSDIPSLIGIEEPEINFHPGILQDIANLIKRLSNRTQVIFTTHSSQLLDCFSTEEISSDISIILLNQKGEAGTKACLLDKLSATRDDLSDWMNDFGIGSAIYHSNLIEEILTKEYA
ncbi:AAA family ATPase [Sphaerospermopsis sp. LEGE 08334]|jgi:predicted ATPase|uniref:AAA family ATPase n=1 Tax=Sphaerospermopsis sp. LEGE 08334 TaxID=1828651 RepID=UPI001880FC97|nr:AAA family ATPase [Sphaerospermopsis sp. LEGE 08334]MBE9056325.1 AAA family ATPase [Sphaerospermopsis sp. LEGE 08334]